LTILGEGIHPSGAIKIEDAFDGYNYQRPRFRVTISPDKVGIYFLKERPHYLDVDQELINHAAKMVSHVHKKTKTDKKEEYPKQVGPLCNWGRGCCEYYHLCFPDN